MEIMTCATDLACPSVVHLPACPWHPRNTLRIVVPAELLERLERDLADDGRELPKLRALLAETSPFSEVR